MTDQAIGTLKTIVINVADTETTGFKPPPHGDIVEIAVTRLTVVLGTAGNVHDIRIGSTISELADPRCEIALEAMAVHHITPKMLVQANALPASEVKEKFKGLPADYWAFHNASFDLKFFQPDKPVICTMKMAQAIWPIAPSHKNQVLRYWLGLDSMMDPARMGDAHRAGFDSYVTACLLAKGIWENKMSIADMTNVQADPIHRGVIAFGKYKGTPWDRIPKSYLLWLRDNTTDEAVCNSCKHYLKTSKG